MSSTDRTIFLNSVIDGRVIKKNDFYCQHELSQKDIDEIKKRKACINCVSFELMVMSYISDGLCKDDRVNAGIGDCLGKTPYEGNCPYFGRRE